MSDIPLMKEWATWARDGLDLLDHYEGWHVAIWGDEILAIDPDEEAVYSRAYDVMRVRGVLYPSREPMLVKLITSEEGVLRG